VVHAVESRPSASYRVLGILIKYVAVTTAMPQPIWLARFTVSEKSLLFSQIDGGFSFSIYESIFPSTISSPHSIPIDSITARIERKSRRSELRSGNYIELLSRERRTVSRSSVYFRGSILWIRPSHFASSQRLMCF
jgi:hypothetical protein